MRIAARVASVLTVLSVVDVVALASFSMPSSFDDGTTVRVLLVASIPVAYVAVLLLGAYCLWTAYECSASRLRLAVLAILVLHWLCAGLVQLSALASDLPVGPGEMFGNIAVMLLCFCLAALTAMVAVKSRVPTSAATTGAS